MTLTSHVGSSKFDCVILNRILASVLLYKLLYLHMAGNAPTTKLWEPMNVSDIQVDSSLRHIGPTLAVTTLMKIQQGYAITCAVSREMLENLGWGKLS